MPKNAHFHHFFPEFHMSGCVPFPSEPPQISQKSAHRTKPHPAAPRICPDAVLFVVWRRRVWLRAVASTKPSRPPSNLQSAQSCSLIPVPCSLFPGPWSLVPSPCFSRVPPTLPVEISSLALSFFVTFAASTVCDFHPATKWSLQTPDSARFLAPKGPVSGQKSLICELFERLLNPSFKLEARS
jgi:hypothetical protein